MARKILIGNPVDLNDALKKFRKEHGDILEGYTDVTSINGEEITLNCRKFEDGFLIGLTDEAIFYGSMATYEWNEEKNTYIKA